MRTSWTWLSFRPAPVIRTISQSVRIAATVGPSIHFGQLFGQVGLRAVQPEAARVASLGLAEIAGIEDSKSRAAELFAYLDTCARLWEWEELNRLWNGFLDAYPHNVPMWKRYITFCQSNFAAFDVVAQRHVFASAFATLNDERARAAAGTSSTATTRSA